MLEKITHIKNPLTVIAIFSAVAEISGTTVLPFIAESNQSIYIWFLMLFPTLLVIIFFLTLNWNHEVLYAPSDYKNENNFFKSLRNATTEEKIEKLKEEIDEVADVNNNNANKIPNYTDSANEPNNDNVAQPPAASDVIDETNNNPVRAQQDSSSEKTTSTDAQHTPATITTTERKAGLLANYALAEKLSILKLSKELDINFKTDVRVGTHDDNYVIFDALEVKKRIAHGIQVKLFQKSVLEIQNISKTFEKISFVSKSNEGRFILHFVAVLDNPNLDPSHVKEKLSMLTKHYDFIIEIHVFTLSDLKNEYQNGIGFPQRHGHFR